MYLNPLAARANKAILEYPEAVAYLGGRGLGLDDIERFSLGYMGIINIKDDGSDDYQRMHKETFGWKTLQHKILFPLHNIMGNVNGIVARPMVLEEGMRKYSQCLSSEAKTIGTFFGLPQALPEIIRTGMVYVVEGAVDCISLAKVYPNTVSTLTAYIDEEQYWALKMVARKICVVFDTDAAGDKGDDIVSNKYQDKDLIHRKLGYNDANACLKALGQDKFKTYVRKKLAVASF